MLWKKGWKIREQLVRGGRFSPFLLPWKSLLRTDLVLSKKEGHNKIWIFSCSMYLQVKRFPACNCIIVSTCKEWCAIKEKGLSVGRDILRWKGRHNLFLVKALHSHPSALLLPHSLHPCSPQLGPHKMLTQMVFWDS